ITPSDFHINHEGSRNGYTTPRDLTFCRAPLSSPSVNVGARLRVVSHSGDRGHVERAIESSVASAIQSMTCGDSRRSEEHTSELQSRFDLVCRLLLEKKKL